MARNDCFFRKLTWLAFCVLFSHALPETSIGQTSTDDGRRDIVDPQLVMRERFDELARMVQSGIAPDRGRAVSWLGQTKWPAAHAEQAAKLLCDVLQCPDATDREIAARALQEFAHTNPAHAAQRVPSLVKTIPNAGEGELVEIVGALAEIGPAAAPALPSLRRALQDDINFIVRIHALAAQLRLDPEDRQSLNLLVSFLANKDAGYRWRAADALRRVGPPAKPATAALRSLLDDDDPRVRVTAAGAIWAIDQDTATVLPVLFRSMREPGRALSTKFIYPSYRGDSHRVYSAKILGEIGPQAVTAMPALIATIEEMAVDLDDIPPYEAAVGLSAMAALGRIGPAAREALPVIRAVKQVKHSRFAVSPQVVEEAIARIEERGD